MERQQEFIDLVDQILAEFEQFGYPLPADALERITSFEGEINKRVSELYGL